MPAFLPCDFVNNLLICKNPDISGKNYHKNIALPLDKSEKM